MANPANIENEYGVYPVSELTGVIKYLKRGSILKDKDLKMGTSRFKPNDELTEKASIPWV